MNAFLIFCKRHRSVVKQKYPLLENRSITKILGEWWAALDIDQKHKYTELARQYKEAFMKANPHFKWYKTDIKAPAMQPPSPPPIAPRTENNNVASNSSLQQNVQTNSTPKPPKKRYLESREFKGSNHTNHTPVNTSAPQPETKRQKTPPLIGGPPILDIDTMNRVIENAFGANPSNNSIQRSNSVLSARNEKPMDERSGLGDRGIEKCAIKNHQVTTNNVPTASIQTAPNGVFRNTDANTSSHDKPLNLSSSKVLHTSNQQIIDHFIDKLLSTAPTVSKADELKNFIDIFSFLSVKVSETFFLMALKRHSE
ncbi:SOX transcription factor-like protein [Leptotrombidium deliense]|uniref:SOX transcription factor-like protein n=1 Tax=Leptotrombidium deliense TaxID=299467 RepID=A0A443SU78_9ACAR|nr:SOX transcription factor-like protein [Leptotrombidium deliense]